MLELSGVQSFDPKNIRRVAFYAQPAWKGQGAGVLVTVDLVYSNTPREVYFLRTDIEAVALAVKLFPVLRAHGFVSREFINYRDRSLPKDVVFARAEDWQRIDRYPRAYP